MSSKRNGSNPLYDIPSLDQAANVKAPSPSPKPENHPENTSQQGLPPDWTRATFIVRKESVEILKSYAYTQRRTLKDVIQEALDQYISGIDRETLLERK